MSIAVVACVAAPASSRGSMYRRTPRPVVGSFRSVTNIASRTIDRCSGYRLNAAATSSTASVWIRSAPSTASEETPRVVSCNRVASGRRTARRSAARRVADSAIASRIDAANFGGGPRRRATVPREGSADAAEPPPRFFGRPRGFGVAGDLPRRCRERRSRLPAARVPSRPLVLLLLLLLVARPPPARRPRPGPGPGPDLRVRGVVECEHVPRRVLFDGVDDFVDALLAVHLPRRVLRAENRQRRIRRVKAREHRANRGAPRVVLGAEVDPARGVDGGGGSSRGGARGPRRNRTDQTALGERLRLAPDVVQLGARHRGADVDAPNAPPRAEPSFAADRSPPSFAASSAARSKTSSSVAANRSRSLLRGPRATSTAARGRGRRRRRVGAGRFFVGGASAASAGVLRRRGERGDERGGVCAGWGCGGRGGCAGGVRLERRSVGCGRGGVARGAAATQLCQI